MWRFRNDAESSFQASLSNPFVHYSPLLFSQNFELKYTTPIDPHWHDCPYPKPTAKLYGADKAGVQKTEWRNTWIEGTGMTGFQTEILEFIEGKNLRFTRQLTTPDELKFVVEVLEAGTVTVGPCLTYFKRMKEGAPETPSFG